MPEHCLPIETKSILYFSLLFECLLLITVNISILYYKNLILNYALHHKTRQTNQLWPLKVVVGILCTPILPYLAFSFKFFSIELQIIFCTFILFVSFNLNHIKILCLFS